jgi:hypothetical protein
MGEGKVCSFDVQEVARQAQLKAEDQECTFQPAAGGASQNAFSGSRRASIMAETQQEFVERLAGDGVRRQMVLQAIDNIQMAKYPFHPNINPRSRSVCTPTLPVRVIFITLH